MFAMLFAIYFMLCGCGLSILLELGDIHLHGLRSTVELMNQLEETLPTDDTPEEKKELSDTADWYLRSADHHEKANFHTAALTPVSLFHQFAIKEYDSEIVSPPPEV